ncbi:MAG: hypothetical protein AB8I08_23015, partial [Sandaracinaceae bacterium]
EWTATLGGVDIRPLFAEGTPHRAELTLEADVASELAIVRGGDAPFECRVSLTYRPTAVTAADALDQASSGGAIYTYSTETGAINGAVIQVPTTGSTPSERGTDFLTAHAEAFGVDPSTLRESDQWESPDGWVTLVYEQYFGEVFGLDALFELELDAEGVVRTVNARAYAGLSEAPAFVLDASQALTLAAPEVGEADTFQRVVYDLSAPRPGWYVVGLEGAALIDDASATVERVDSGYYEMPLELQTTTPAPAPLTYPGSWSRSAVVRGDTTTGLPAGLDSPNREVFTVISAIANELQTRTGSPGWAGGRGQVVTQSAIREGVDPEGNRVAGAFYLSGSRNRFMFLDGDARGRRDTLCHEYGHVYDDARAGLGAPVFSEMYGDVFYLFCEGWVSNGPYVYNGSGRVHTGATPREDQRDYDRFLERGISETDIARSGPGESIVPHDYAFLVTIPFYEMMENRGLDREKASALGLSAAAGSYSSFPEVRDRILREAVSWARSGRHGFTEADVCAVAQGFRVTKLDGEYGRGAGCEETERAELTCTANFCPLCGDDAPATVCRPETLAEGQPVCMTSDGRRTCVGSIATSAEGCGEGASHLCWCVGDGQWDCSTSGPCVDDPDARQYCPEDPGSGPSPAMPPACSASPTRSSSFTGLLVGLVGLMIVRRRR